jgi:type IX secretion system substrate protein/VCBS repeat protein
MKKNYIGHIYSDLLSKYRKFSFRLQKNIANGTFWKLTVQKRQALLARIEKLRTRLEAMNPKLAGAAIATGLMLTAGTAIAQPNFVQQTGTNNPAGFIVLPVSGYGAPTFADLDNDGDKDMILADGDYYSTTLRYMKNTGTATAPVFAEQSGTNSPFSSMTLNGEYYTVPTLGDIDGDGDFDLLTGHDGDVLQFYRNTGTNTAAVFTFETGTIFPSINTVSGNYYDELSPSFVDIDADGDLDVMIGNEDISNMVMLKNTGTATAPVYTFIGATDTSNPFAAVNPVHTGYARVEPGFGDIDKDGDIDAWISGETVTQYFRNTGTPAAASFLEVTGTNNPFASFVRDGYSYAAFVDIDADGDKDYFVGSGTFIDFYLNTDPSSNVSVADMDNISNMVSVFPNPVQNSVNVSIKNAEQLNPSVVIMDIRGVEVMKYQATDNNFVIDISTLASGIYTMKITSDDQIAIKKIVKN